MTTSQETSFITEALTAEKISESTFAYFQERFKIKLHELVLTQFAALQKESGFSKADLARKVNKDPSQITRWFRATGNITADTISDLLLAMGAEAKLDIAQLNAQDGADDRLPDWLSAETPTAPTVPLKVIGSNIHNLNGSARSIGYISTKAKADNYEIKVAACG